jgi:very-short-patch-repair endonuclease
LAKKKLTPVARKLRRASTDAEMRLWSHLRARQLENAKFVRQFQIGSHVADFACRSARLVIELDGGQHAIALDADAARTRMIEAHGYSVIRIWNNDVMENLDGVLEAILQHLRIASNE